jgi:hypothetical protein
MDWAALAYAAPDPNLLQRSRQNADLPTILDALGVAAIASTARRERSHDRARALLLNLGQQRRRSTKDSPTPGWDEIAVGFVADSGFVAGDQ